MEHANGFSFRWTARTCFRSAAASPNVCAHMSHGTRPPRTRRFGFGGLAVSSDNAASDSAAQIIAGSLGVGLCISRGVAVAARDGMLTGVSETDAGTAGAGELSRNAISFFGRGGGTSKRGAGKAGALKL